MIRKTYKYRLYPTRAQVDLLTAQLSEACRLYNAALQERRDAWRINRKSISLYDQTYQLKEIFADGDCDIKGFSAAWYVLDRVNKSFAAFFRRVKAGQKAGFPRFKSFRRFDSFTWQIQANDKPIKDGKLRIPKMGTFRLKLHRAIEGKIKTCTVKREAGRWYVCFSVECEAKPLPPCSEAVGIDVGLTTFATLSDGAGFTNPRWYKEAQAKLRLAQRRVARRKKGGSGRRKAVQLLQRAHAHIRQQRADFHHKVSRQLVNTHGLIAVEDLSIKGLVSGMLAKSVQDAGWDMFLEKIAYKAEDAGRQFFRVNPSGTTQNCSGCGHKQVKSLAERTHVCDICGLVLNRDHNAAINILRAGIVLAGLTWPNAASVPAESP
jgi:putative transposase